MVRRHGMHGRDVYGMEPGWRSLCHISPYPVTREGGMMNLTNSMLGDADCTQPPARRAMAPRRSRGKEWAQIVAVHSLDGGGGSELVRYPSTCGPGAQHRGERGRGAKGDKPISSGRHSLEWLCSERSNAARHMYMHAGQSRNRYAAMAPGAFERVGHELVRYYVTSRGMLS
jgi:hypothetical protein